MVFLQLLWDPGVYSQVTAGMAIQNSCFFRVVEQGISVSIPLEAENTESLSHTYC